VSTECFFLPPKNLIPKSQKKEKKKKKKRELISNRANLTVTDHKRRCVASQMPLPCGKATHEKPKRQGKKELHDFFSTK
jgi:hypothetical protein